MGHYPGLPRRTLKITTGVLTRKRQGEFNHTSSLPQRSFPNHPNGSSKPVHCLPLALVTPNTSPVSPLGYVPTSSMCPAHSSTQGPWSEWSALGSAGAGAWLWTGKPPPSGQPAPCSRSQLSHKVLCQEGLRRGLGCICKSSL